MEKWKRIGMGVLLVLFLVSLTMLFIAGRELMTMRSADSYEDKGVYTFIPSRVLPHQVKNTSSFGRSRRMNPTKTEYMLYYRTADQSRYEWKVRVPSKSSGEKTIEEGKTVERKVLSIPEAGTYITIEPGQTAEEYVASMRRYYLFLAAGSVIALLAFAGVGFALMRKRH